MSRKFKKQFSSKQERKRARNVLKRRAEQEKDISRLTPEKRKQRLIKIFYVPLQRLGVDIKYPELMHIAAEVCRLDNKDRNKHRKDCAELEKIKKQAASTLEAISLEKEDA